MSSAFIGGMADIGTQEFFIRFPYGEMEALKEFQATEQIKRPLSHIIREAVIEKLGRAKEVRGE